MAMDSHVHKAELQTLACSAICRLSTDIQVKNEIARLDGISAIVIAVNNYVYNTVLRSRARRALQRLTLNHSGNADQVAYFGGIDAIFK